MWTTLPLWLLSVLVTPTPEGCHPVTPPPGAFGATQCNFDREFGVVGNLVYAVDVFVFLPLGFLFLAIGLFAALTAKGPVPAGMVRRLPREPASLRDHRLQGLSLAFGGAAIVLLSSHLLLDTALPPQPPPPTPNLLGAALSGLAVMAMIAAIGVGLTVRQRDHKSSEVLSGWQHIGRLFRG